jgi:phage recombination protein Bet
MEEGAIAIVEDGQQVITEENPAVQERKRIELIKTTVCKGSTDDEFALFMHASKRTGLDPLMRQIHAVKRWDSKEKREVMSIQTGIDGYRLIAERTGRYVPGSDTKYQYDDKGRLISATAFVKKQTSDGQWHEIPCTAFYSEYVGTTKDGSPNRMWKDKPHIMLAKCGEALALRKCFPAELSGVYTAEEMNRSESQNILPESTINPNQVKILLQAIGSDPSLLDRIMKWQGIKSLNEMRASKFNEALNGIRTAQKKEQPTNKNNEKKA